MTQNRAQRREAASIKGVSKNQLLARAQAGEASTQMFQQLYEQQIRASERITIEAERLVQKAQLEQRATERTIEVMLYQLTPLEQEFHVTQESLDAFNEEDKDGDFFVHVEQTNEGFDMTLVFEIYEQEEENDESDPDTGSGDTYDDNVDIESSEEAADGDTDEAE